ncbi:ribonuclease Z [Marinobacterium sediminicola]|uniref:Ribonuclease Z n=1 Tax=Marinobacterium sediminicola TaxID=518898 RepID=A0ABY1S2N1_9GAMM|nr:ribonuclease Z [Marinobacterium sediminicola]ULG68853.1 ribonuclease Z [Marinobacterium sediminicola]SMR77537.1 ribonuclease Z [Marinobacterium sediminicola]
MNLTFLGTSSGAPTRQRNVSATAVQPEYGRAWVMVDCGEATQHQLLRTRLSPLKLDAILITHVHGDHCYGLPGLLASCQLNGRTEPLTLVGPAAVWAYLQAVIEHTEMRIDYPLKFIDVSKSLALEQGGFHITAYPLSHRSECWAYRLQESRVPLKLDVARLEAEGVMPSPLYGRLQRGESVTLDDGRQLEGKDYCIPSYRARAVVIGGDNDRPELLAEACRGVQLLVHEATYTEDVLQQVGPEPQHSSAARVARFAEQAGVPALVLTHFSPRYLLRPRRGGDRSVDELYIEAQRFFAGTLFMAEDFQTYRVLRDGRVVEASD